MIHGNRDIGCSVVSLIVIMVKMDPDQEIIIIMAEIITVMRLVPDG
jgi:hypothetical protein